MKDIKDKGKKQLQIICGLYILIELITSINVLITLGTSEFITAIVRIAISVGIFYLIFKKKNWARILMVVLFLLGGLSGLMLGLAQFDLLLLAMGVTFSASGVMLLVSKPIKAYMNKIKETIITAN